MALDKLVVDIEANATSFNKGIMSAQKSLATFNTKIVEGNRAVNSFVSGLNRSAASFERLTATTNALKTNFTGLSRSINSSAASVNKFGSAARTAASDVKAFSSQLSRIASSFERLGGASKSATAAINSLQRRVTALSATVSAVNGNMRTFNRTVEMATAGAARGGVVVNNYGRAVASVGRTANTSAGLFGRLNKANITLAEGFRRHVAQLTALRTLTYQAIFWFSPLIYSIVKVNAQYEKQMQLLKNLSGQSSELGKMQWAQQTRQALIQLANTNPFSLDQITESFVRMKVSGLDPLNGGLQTLMDSIAAFGGGNDELQRAGIALQQMVGKSAVSMEELRQQLGEHIPDAMKAMAAGMGLSMAEFYKAVQHGTVESTEAIKKMLAVLNAQHRGAAANMMLTWNGMLARLGTAWQNFVAKLEHHPGRNTFIDTLKQEVTDLLVFLNSPAGVNFAISVEQSLATAAKAIAKVIQTIYQWRNEIIEAAKIFAIIWGGKLVIGTITSFVSVFANGLKLVIVAIRALTGAEAAAALITTRFGAAIRAMAVGLGIAATSAEAAAMSIGTIAAAMAGAIGIALALAGAIYLVVKALNAKTDAEKNAALAKSAAEGRPWNSKDEQMAERNRLLDLKKRADAGGEYVQAGEGTPVWIAYSKSQIQKMNSDYNAGAHAYNLRNANTHNANVSMVNTQFEAAQPDPYATVRSKYNDMEANITDGKKLNAIEQQKNNALAQAAQADVMRLEKMKKTASPDQKLAIDQLIEKRKGDYQSFIAGQAAEAEPNKFVQGKKTGKKKKKGTNDPLEGARSSFVNSVVQTADLQHQYEDLVNHTSTEFDPEAARAEGERAASLLKTKAALQAARDAEHARQEEIKKSIKVEQAIDKIQDANAAQDAKVAEDVDNLKVGYDSVNLASKHFQEQLVRENRQELEIAKARIDSGHATEDNIRQYKELTAAITAAVRAKQAELVVAAAQDAKSANEEFDASLRSPNQQATYEASIEYARYSEALKMARDLAASETETDKDLEAAKKELAEAQRKLTEATDEQAKADGEIIVLGVKKRITDDEATKAAIASIPYLQRRLDILNEEATIRQKFNGMGGPLFDWAKKASADFTDLGASMGSVLTGAMDDFVNSLAEGKMAFADFAKTVLKQLLLIIIRGLIAKAIMSALGLGGISTPSGGDWNVGLTSDSAVTSMPSMDIGSMLTPIGHTGGIAGNLGTTRSIDPALFSFAQRYHTGGIVGLRDGEVPIIAQRGEGIFTQEQMKALGQNNKGSNVQVNVINQTGVEADVHREQPKFDGEKWVESIILKKMVKPGPVRDGLNALVSKR